MKVFCRVMGVAGLFMAITVSCTGTGTAGKTSLAPEMAQGAPMVIAAGDAVETGEAVYNKVCKLCHAVGLAGAPKIGDQETWKPRIVQGMETLVSRAINGYQGSAGMMPARGGNPALSDDEVAAAVAYMVDKSR